VGLEKGLLVGAVLFLLGLVAAILSFTVWNSTGFGELDAGESVRIVVPAVLGFMLGAQVWLNSFFLSILGLGRRNRPVVDPAGAGTDVPGSPPERAPEPSSLGLPDPVQRVGRP
jgi:hypothetical protein